MKTVQTKQNISANVALAYLNGLYSNAADLLQDAEYYRAFKTLEKRVNDMLETPYDGDIIDEYVIVEQEDTAQAANAETPCTDAKAA